jgi:hypothetical protein
MERKMKKDKITVEAWVHWKQGDEFAGFLKEYSAPKALEMWGKSLVERGKGLIQASEILAGQDIEGWGDTHGLSLSNVDRNLAEELFKLGMFHQDHFEKEHETCEGCEECYGIDFTPVESFMDVVGCMKDEIEQYYEIFTTEEPKGKRRLAFHLPCVYNIWKKNATTVCENEGLEPKLISKADLMRALRDEPYYITDNKLKRVNGRPQRSMILSLDEEDDPEGVLLSFRLESD